MFLYSLSLNADDLSIARKHLAHVLPAVSRSHLAEALAAAQGFNTSIAMQTFVRTIPVDEKRYSYFNAETFFNRLVSLGNTFLDAQKNAVTNTLFPEKIRLDFIIVSEGAVQSSLSDRGRLDSLKAPAREAVDACKLVLSHVSDVLETPCADYNSYWVKHRIEEAFGAYIPNGAVIQAAVELGLSVQSLDGPNVEFYVAEQVMLDAVTAAQVQCKKELVSQLIDDALDV